MARTVPGRGASCGDRRRRGGQRRARARAAPPGSLRCGVVSVLLDTNVVQQDWLCRGLRFELIRHNRFYPPLRVYLPAVVLEELVANQARELGEARRLRDTLGRKLARLGATVPAGEVTVLDYRAYLTERFDEVLGVTVLGWPPVDHAALVARAVGRRAPFDAKGGGYRDALVWADAVGLAAAGHEVVLVSQDRAFGADGALHSDLAAETEALPGSVALAAELGEWLLSRLPWTSAGLADAVSRSRDEQFHEWYLQSDFQDGLVPDPGDLGLPAAPYSLDVLSVEWDGGLDRAGERDAGAGVAVVEYDIGQTVEFLAEMPAGTPGEDGWDVRPSHLPGRVMMSGEVSMTVRVGVLFDTDYWGIDELAWRRADGTGPGPDMQPLYAPQPGLF